MPRDGLAAVTCRLDAIDATLRDAAPSDLGGAPLQARLLKNVAAVRRAVDGAVPGDARARGPLLRAARTLRSVATTVARSGRRGKVRADLATRIADDATQAATALVAGARR